MKTIQREIVTCYILSADDKLLLGMKDPAGGGVYVGYWHNPGGGIEPGETKEQALYREVLEETGIDITGKGVQVVDDKATGESVKTLPYGEQVLAKMHMTVYKVVLDQRAKDIKTATSDDLVKLKWFPLADFSSIKFTPPAVVLFDRIGTDWLLR